MSPNVGKGNPLQVAAGMLHVTISGCKWFQWLQKVEPSSIASVIQCNILYNLYSNGVARQVAGRLQRVTCSLSNLSHNCFGLATIAQSKAQLSFLQRLYGFFKNHCKSQLKNATCNMTSATCNALFSNVARQFGTKIAVCNTSLLCCVY